MTWDGAITALEAHMAASGTASVRGGEPNVPAQVTYAWYYTGAGDNPLIGETLTDHPYDDQVECRFYWPVATRDAVPSRDLENLVRNTARTFIARLEADRDLGGNVTDLTIGDAVAGWLDLAGNPFRIVTLPLSFGQTDSEPIAR